MKKRGKIFWFTLLIIAGLSFNINKNYAKEDTGEEVRLYLGEVKTLPVSTPYRIVIGNPNAIDVLHVTKAEVTINPKAVGKSTLVIWDSYGEQSYTVKVLAENLTDIKSRIDDILSKLALQGIYTRLAENEGKVFILGEVKTPQEREKITIALGALKEKTVDLTQIKEEETGIDIDVQVLELDKDATSTLGFSLPAAITLTELGSPGISATGTKWSTLFQVLNLNRTAFTLTLDALVQQGKARVLSQPKLVCQSGKEAELMVGGEKPVFTTTVAATTGAQGTSVEYKEFGIKLNIKPIITEKDRIKLALKIEVSEVGTAEFIGAATNKTAQAYPLTKRNISTEVFLNDGQTLAIGGLIKQKTEEDIRKTPGFGDMPILGSFFRKKTTKIGGGQGERGNVELFVTLTPNIVKDKQTLKEVKKEIEVSSQAAPLIQKLPDSPLKTYAYIIQKRISENISYPNPAKQAGFQGTVTLSLLFSYRGELLDAKIKNSSGHNLLDESAIKTAKGIAPYPPFPPSIEEKEIYIDIPVTYKLD